MILKDLKSSKSEILINVAYTLEFVPESKDYSSRDFEIEYLKANVCKTRQEKEIIERVLKRSPSGATIKRYRAWLQNEMLLYEKSENKKKLDKELEKQTIEDLRTIKKENIFTKIKNLFTKKK